MDPGSLKNLLSQHGESHLFDNSVVTMEASNRLRFVKPIDGSGRFTIGELVIVIGEERSWLSEERARHYVMTARLPMVCRVDLFNVSVGTTVAMDEVVRQSMVSW
jgi:tRNA G18 (ribose-2'-O)-methylase SpoU